MKQRRRMSRFVLAASLAASAGWPVSVAAQEGAQPPPPSAPEAPAGEAQPPKRPSEPAPAAADQAPETAAQPKAPAEVRIRFNFKDAPFDQVLDFFSRECRLPVITEAAVPQGTMTFISGESYTFDEALQILNQILLMHRVNLRQDGNYLYLADVKRAVQVGGPVFQGEVPVGVAPAEIVTVTIPLSNSRADVVAGQIKGMVADYGSVTAVPQQNVLIVVETAEQCRRIQKIVEGIDSQGPADTQTKVFKLRHAKASVVFAALKELVKVRVQQIIIDQQKGTRQQVEDTNLEGLNFYADERTNSILAVGPEARLALVDELIALLDTPDGASGEREMMTFALRTVTPQEAAAKLDGLFAQVPADRKPVVLPLPEAGKLTLVGSPTLLMQAVALLGEIDPAVGDEEGGPAPERRAATLRLAHITPPQVEGVVGRLLTARQQQALRWAATPDGRGLLVSGPSADVAAFEELVGGLDVPADVRKEVRQVRIAGPDAAAVCERAAALYDASKAEGDGEVTWTADAESGTATLIGDRAEVERFASLLTQVQQIAPPRRTTKILDVQRVKAVEIVGPLREFLASADPIDASRKVPEPSISVVERTNSLLVQAEEAQHALIADYVARLDRLEPAEVPPLKLLQLRAADANAVAAMLNEQYGKRPQADRAARPVEVRADGATNTLIVSSHPELFDEIKAFVAELNKEQGEGPERVTELFPLKVAKAEAVAAAMDRLYPEPPMPRDRLNRPMPWLQQPKEVTVSAEPSSNSLIIDAPADRMESLRELAAKLDRVELPPVAELRTYRVVGADLEAIARTLQGLSRQGNLSSPAQPGKPQVQVVIDAEPKSQTLIVAGDDVTFQRVEQVLKDLSQLPVEKGLRVVPVANAKAEDVRGRALEIYDAQVAQIPGANPVEVTVDEDSNSLMVVADAEAMERFMKIMDELQRQAGPAREMRMLELRSAKAADVVAFLTDMARSSEGFAVRGGPEPLFEAIEATNSVMVAAQPGQMPVIEQLVRSLDNQRAADRPPMRILRLRTTDAANLALVLQQSYDRRPAEQKAKQPVEIDADPATNTLIVSAHADVLPEIEAIVADLNETQTLDAEGREIRIFPLKVARAEELAKTIDAMYPEPPMPIDPRTRQPRPDLQRTKEVVVRADRATNSLIVDAPAQRLAGFERIVEQLDQQKLAGNVEVRTYRVERADLNAITGTLRNLAQTGAIYGTGAAGNVATPVTVDAEPTTRTIVVSGPSEVFKAVESVLREMDAAPDLPSTGVKMYALKNARAERLQPLVQRLVAGRVREQQLAAGASADEAAALVEVVADAASNTIVVTAPEAALAVADALVQTLDQQSTSSAVEMRVFRLAKGDAASAADAVRASLAADPAGAEQQATVTAEPASNTIVIVGTQAQLERAGQLIQEMDTAVDPEGLGIRTIPVKHGRAESIAPVLEKVLTRENALDKLPEWSRAQVMARTGEIPPDTGVRVAAERSLNAVVVSGPMSVLDLAEQVVRELDVDPARRGAAAAARAVRVIPLTNADANELSATIAAVFAEDASGQEPPTIRVDTASNALIVRALASQMETIEALARQVDAAALSGSRQLRMIPVDRSRADAALMAETLRRLLEQQAGVKVEVIPAEQLLQDGGGGQEPKQTGDAGETPHVLPLKGGVGAALATFRVAVAIGGFEQPQHPGDASPVAAREDAAVTIAVDAATNSLVVVGSPRMTDRIAALAQQLESQMPAEPTKVRIVTLPATMDARPLAQVVMQTVGQLGRAGPTNPGGFTGAVSVAPDPSGGALIVWANDTDFASVGALIGSLTQLDAATELTVKIYPLSSVTAQRAVQAVNDLLSPSPRGRQAQRLRGDLDLMLSGPEGGEVRAKVDPALVRVMSDPSGTSLIVAAPADAVPLIDRFVSVIDQSPVANRLAIRRYELRNAQASDLSRTLQQLFDAQRQGPSASELPQARFVGDERTNSILVTAAEAQHADVARLLETMDAELADEDLKLEIITLQNALPTVVQRIVEQVVVGRDPAKKDRVQISAQDNSSLFVVRAPAEQIEEIRSIVAQVDTGEIGGLPVRSVKLERADAQSVATALQRFFADRAAASAKPGQQAKPRVAVVGDRKSGTLVVSASDDDWAQVQSLVATFDAPAPARDMQWRIIPLKNARVTDVGETIQSIASELQWERMGGMWMWGGRGQQDAGGEDKLFVQTNERSNSVVVMGQGQTLETIVKIIEALDQPQSEQTRLAVRAVPVEGADLNAIAAVIRQAMVTPGWQRWRGPDPDAVEVSVDTQRRLLLLVGKGPRVELAAAYAKELAEAGGATPNRIESITLQYAQADRAAQSLNRFFAERARASGLPAGRVSIVGSSDGNVLMVSAGEEDMKLLRDLVAQIDQPELGKNRIEVYALKHRRADDVATTLRANFPRRQGPDEQVIVTPQPSTNSLIVNAPEDRLAQVEALLARLDAAPTADEARITTVTLKSGRAQDVAQALQAAMPEGLRQAVKITPVPRNNSLLLTGSDEAIGLVMEQIAKIDVEAERPLVEFKRFKLKNAVAFDVYYTLRQMLAARPRTPSEPVPSVDYSTADNTLAVSASAEQLRDIEKMIDSLDVAPEETRTTEFVKLEFAKAEGVARALEVFYGQYAVGARTAAARNVTIVPDPASNSLIIMAQEGEWAGIRELLKKLDTEEYDTSRQLAVIPLLHADAASVARALNDGFRAPVDERFRREQARRQQTGRGRDDRDAGPETPILIDAEGTPSVSAEPQTNTLVIFAARRDLDRIRGIITQLDVPDFDKFPEARVIPLQSGKASQLAAAVREMFTRSTPGGRSDARRSVVIAGDDASNALLVRAEDREFAQIKALVETLQQQGDATRATVRVLPLRSVPAARLQRTLMTTFQPSAQQLGEPLAVEVDRTANALVIASSERLYEEIRRVVEELDAAVPGAEADPHGAPVNGLGQSVFIIDVQNNSPEDVRRLLEQMGLTRPAPADRPGVVSEPVTIVPLLTRRALAVVAGPRDGEAVTALVRAIDAAPASAEQHMQVVPLKMAAADALVRTLEQMITPGAGEGQTAPARAIAEQVRRLNLARGGASQPDLAIDLAQPIRLIPDTQTNAVVIGSTRENVASLAEIVRSLDTLPIGDAVVVRMFPLSNASAVRVKSVVDELFRQGEELRRLPGTQRRGLPSTATGQALAGEIAVSVDDRTNMLIVAGREEAVALVEVLVRDLDSDEASSWIEPTIVQLKHADAVKLAATLRQALVQGLSTSPESLGLQRQIGRLRMVREGLDPTDPAGRVDSDLFAPLSGLVITPDQALNALIVVGSTSNVAVVKELVAMLDVEAAAASNSIRVFPLKHAAADRIETMVSDIFRQREQAGATRPEDRPIVTVDVRTNALIVSASPRSFDLIDALLRTLDAPGDAHTVGLHVLPVEGADAMALAPRIARLMRERIEATQRAGAVSSPMDTFSVEADPANNLLIVAASEENFRLVQELVGTLAKGNAAITGAERTELIQLESAQALEIANTLLDLYVAKENARRGEGAVSVLPNERLNALVVTGSEADVRALRTLVERFDRAPVTMVRDVRRLQLRTANALEVVRLLESVLAGRPVSGDRNGVGARQATRLRFLRDQIAGKLEGQTGREPTEAELDGAIREHVTLTPELRTNSVYVNAPPQIMALIEEIVAELDNSSAGSRRIAKFSMTNADAGKMAELLRDLFNLQQQGDRFVLLPSGSPDATSDEDPLSSTPLTAVPDARQELSITIDARTNTLLVSGTEEYLQLVEDVVTELDAIEGRERVRQVVHLQNANAKEVETTLTKYFQDEADRLRQTLGPESIGSVMSQLEQEVTIVGDEKSNKLVVSASPRYIDTVTRIIDELDAAPPQVVIEVLLAEVTLDRSGTWGMDIKVGPFGGDAYNLGSFATGAGVTTGVGVPNLSVASADFSLLIRALESQGKLEVLSRPKVQVKNNEKAIIQVGENVPIVTGVERFNQGNSLANVEREDVGIILNVLPTINPDGFVTMSINPEISSVSARTVQVSEDFSAPIINQRKVETVVSVKDGQTVVIGGLIETRQEERRSKVPVLGDIPFLGLPFRTSRVDDVKTELLVILTPRVIPGDSRDDLERLKEMSEQDIERMSGADKIRDMLEGRIPGETEPIMSTDVAEAAATPPAAAAPAPEPATPPQPAVLPAGADLTGLSARGPYAPGMEPAAMRDPGGGSR